MQRHDIAIVMFPAGVGPLWGVCLLTHSCRKGGLHTWEAKQFHDVSGFRQPKIALILALLKVPGLAFSRQRDLWTFALPKATGGLWKLVLPFSMYRCFDVIIGNDCKVWEFPQYLAHTSQFIFCYVPSWSRSSTSGWFGWKSPEV